MGDAWVLLLKLLNQAESLSRLTVIMACTAACLHIHNLDISRQGGTQKIFCRVLDLGHSLNLVIIFIVFFDYYNSIRFPKYAQLPIYLETRTSSSEWWSSSLAAWLVHFHRALQRT